MNSLCANKIMIFVLCAVFVLFNAESRGQSDTFDGTVIDTTKWEVAQSSGSPVTQNDALFITMDGSTVPHFTDMPGAIGRGAGIRAWCELSGDFDIQVDFRDYFPVPNFNFTQMFFGIYQDSITSLHIKRITASYDDGIQTVYTTNGVNRISNGITSFPGLEDGKLRIERNGSTVNTYYDVGTGWIKDLSTSPVFTGDIVVTLTLGISEPEGIASVVYDNYLINSGTIVCPGSTAPEVTITWPSSGLVEAVNVPIGLIGGIDDPDVGDTHTATWTISSENWAEPFVFEGTVTGDMVSDEIEFADAGIYSIKLTVTDASGATGEATTVNDDPDSPAFVVIYDADGGFVTGGGWIYSEQGSYLANPTLEGRANFGFVSKYTKGASTPTGNTEFVFKAADLNFHSNSYDWLVVNQAGANAQFKGSGTINNNDYCKFMLWARDDSVGDTFRIKIWKEIGEVEEVIYDNGFDQLIAGGSIIVHKGKN